MIIIDGRGPRSGVEGYEAGGQILRVALSLSSVLGKDFQISNIRAGRPKPGLQPQHLCCVKAIEEITNAKVEGAELNSSNLKFSPGGIRGGYYTFDTGTAGSVTLLAQSIIPPLLFADKESHVLLRGGTHVEWSPTVDYYKNVFLPLVRKFGCEIEMNINRYGWYPNGGGEVEIHIKPSNLHGIEIIERGLLYEIGGICALSNLNEDIVAREEIGVKEIFKDAKITRSIQRASSAGTAVTLWAIFQNSILGAESRGRLGKKAEEVGREAALLLKNEINSSGTIDSHMTDQILIFAALSGKSTFLIPKLTPHARSCIWVIKKFMNVNFNIKGNRISIEKKEK